MDIPKPYHEKRPWGEELWITDKQPSMVKILTVNPHESLSLQYHHNRDEFWHVLSGNGIATIGKERITLKANQNCFIPRETQHRLESGDTTLTILELAFGDFDENDIVRLDDRYGRIPKK